MKLSRRNFLADAIIKTGLIFIPMTHGAVIPSGPIMRTISAGGASCNTATDDFSAKTGSDWTQGDGQDFMRDHVFQFTAGGSGSQDRCAVKVKLKKTGTPTFNFRIHFLADSTNTPGTEIGTTASTAANGLTTTYVEYTYNFTAPFSMTAGTSYWMGIECDADGSAGNSVVIDYTFGGGNGLHYYDIDNTSNWDNWGTPANIYFITYRQ